MSGRAGIEAGFTLIELMVSMAIMGLVLGVATVALVPALDSAGAAASGQDRLRLSRWTAIEEGRPLVVWPDSAHRDSPTLLLPDGRILGAPYERDAATDTLGGVP